MSSSKLLIIVFIVFILIVGCDTIDDKIIKSTYCWTLEEVMFYIDEEKTNGTKEINFEEMKHVFLEDKEHIKVIGVNNNIEDLEFFIINVDLIFYYKNEKLVLLENTKDLECW
ncbi:MAG TPA: hypothetical protein VKZ45_09920 [Vicingaceae bacterium]|nr:hypothetical protein [Vicingaceae bacterium]